MSVRSLKVLVIPENGRTDSEVIENYVARVRRRYGCKVEIFSFDQSDDDFLWAIGFAVEIFARKNRKDRFEIHAQGNLGAYIAYKLMEACPELIKRVFFIGGAPSNDWTDWPKRIKVIILKIARPQNLRYYLHSLEWLLPPNWKATNYASSYFVPDGGLFIRGWMERMIANKQAEETWKRAKVAVLPSPGRAFSSEMLAPAHLLFKLMDGIRPA